MTQNAKLTEEAIQASERRRGSLVLGRRKHEAIVITTPEGRTIRIELVKRGGEFVETRLLIQAAVDVDVVREELLDPARKAA